ncbi:hypothetical protein [Microbulbifer sp. SAOS-129_SWC]|uniref:hypothetical protein n=1 Tax=Microbulbifer sp. SAOS-129_SWC TaxID=3145235 RepID=UPI0032178F41
MIRLVTLGVAILAFAGCASMNAPDPAIPDNVTLTPPAAYNQQFIDTVRFEEPIEVHRSPARCVAEYVNNRAVTLSDSSSSFVGAFTGNYYQVNNSTESAGGQVLKYSDEKEVVAQGRETYTTTLLGVPIGNAVEFKLLVELGEGVVRLKFSDVQHAQLDTGGAANSGFGPVGAWRGAGPVDAYHVMEGVANKVMGCIGGAD